MTFTEPIHQPFPIPYHGNRIGNKVSLAISNAFRDKRFDRSSADSFGAYLIEQKPLLDGTVVDETPGLKARPEQPGGGSTFSGTEYFEKTDIANSILGTDDTSFTVRARFKGNGSSADGDYIISSYDNDPDEGFRFTITGGFLTFTIKDAANNTRSAISTITEADIQGGAIYDVVGVYDAAEEAIAIYVDAVFHDDNVAVSYTAPTQNIFRIACRADTTTGRWYGAIFEVQIWNSQALTAAEIVKLYDKNREYFTGGKKPSVAWYLNGSFCRDLIGDNDLTPVGPPTTYIGSDGDDSLNRYGYTDFENLITFSEDIDSSKDWGGTANVSASKNVVTINGTTQRLQNALGPNLPVGTYLFTIKTDSSDVGKQIEPVIYDGSWTSGGIKIISADGFVTSEITIVSAGTNVGFRIGAGGTATQTYTLEYIHIRANENASYIATTVAHVDYAIRPKRWSESVDSDGNAGLANSFGPCRENGQLIDGPAIVLDGTMGADTSYDASNRTTLSGTARVKITDTNGDQNFFDQSTGAVGWGFRCENINASTARLVFFHYKAEGGSADLLSPATAIITTNQEHVIGFAWDATSGDADFFVDDLIVTESDVTSTGIMADANPMRIGLPNDGTTQGFRGSIWDLRIFEKRITAAEFDWVRTRGESGTEPTNLVRHWPVIAGGGVQIKELIAGDHVGFVNGPTWGTASNFDAEVNGVSKVPVFVDGVELVGANTDYDGIKSAEVELDFVTTSNVFETIFTIGYLYPFRVQASRTQLRVSVRDSGNGVVSHDLSIVTSGVLNQWKIQIIEDANSPTTASSIVVSNRITGEVVGTRTELDIDLSTSTNYGNQQIGSYATASGSFSGELYRLRHVVGATEKVLWYGQNRTRNETDGESDFTEFGGTLETRNIPTHRTDPTQDVNGYTLSHRVGPYLKGTAKLNAKPVANAPSQLPIFRGASFDGTADGKIVSETNITGYPFQISGSFYLKSSGTQYLAYLHEDSTHYFGVFHQSTSGLQVQRRDGTTLTNVVNAALAQNEWHSYKVVFHNTTSFTFSLDGVATLYDGLDAADAPAATIDGLILGTFRTSTVSSPNHNTKSVQVINDSKIVNDMALLKDSRDRSGNAFHGVETNLAGYLSQFKGSALEIPIDATEIMAVGDSLVDEIIFVGQR